MLESNSKSEAVTWPDILLVGHVTQDLETEDPDGPYRIGGTVSFASVVAVNLGRKPVIITRAAPTTDLSELPPDVELHVLPSPVTTTFANVYTPEGRVQYSYAQALPITVDDIPQTYRAPSTVLLGPLVNEIAPDVAQVFDESAVVGAVPQGWMRAWDDTGRVHSKEWESQAEILPWLDVLVLSLEDIDHDLSRLAPMMEQVSLLVLTEYHDGSTVYRRQENGKVEIVKIPPRPATERDPTGAGDVFTTSFMIRLQETRDPIEAARFANVTASFSVEHPGVSGIPTREEVFAYMRAHPFEPEILFQAAHPVPFSDVADELNDSLE
jgi:1D-myo-inositol 3-kinase